MANFFPRYTTEIRFEEPRAFRKLSFSLVEMAIATGVLLRVLRWLILTHGSNNWLYLAGTFTLGIVLLVGMLTAHLANYPIHQYVWRAPTFALVEVAAEMVTSALLIAVGLEVNGTVRAHWDDWLGMTFNALWIRGLAIVVFSLILAGVVQLVRGRIVQEDDEPDLPANGNKPPTA